MGVFSHRNYCSTEQDPNMIAVLHQAEASHQHVFVCKDKIQHSLANKCKIYTGQGDIFLHKSDCHSQGH